MKLILTEKPSVTKLVKNALAPDAKFINLSKGKMPVGYYENKDFVICNSVGHIIEIVPPNEINKDYSKWDINQLPYSLPYDLPTRISSDKKQILKTIQHCMDAHDYEEVIIATDGDREGQNIWRKIKLHLKNYKPKKEMRMWLSEWTNEGIKDAYKKRFPNSKKENLGIAAQCREESDYLIGMEGTVAMTTKYAKGKGNVLSVGRVMTATQKIVVERENEIRNFVPEDYIAIQLVTSSDTKENLTLRRLSDRKIKKEEAAKITEEIKKEKNILLNKTVKITKKKCPLLYDATSIAKDMNKRYGFNAKKTSDIIQKLYQDYQLTTYPGTNDCRISESSAKEVYKILDNLTICGDIVDEIQTNKWQIAKHLVTTDDLAHEAITPVYGKISIDKVRALSKDELLVYRAIVERFLAAFYPEAEFEEVSIKGMIKTIKEEFGTNGKTVLKEGWQKVLGKDNDVLLPPITDGKMYSILDVKQEEKQTTPPPRYTEATLLEAMENAGRFVTDKEEQKILKSKDVNGIGTGRTRPQILENIKNRNYFEIKKKTIYPTDKCMLLFEVLPNSMLSSPSLTAKFEQMIQGIEDGTFSRKEYMDFINQNLNALIDAIKKDNKETSIGNESKAAVDLKSPKSELICPLCGGKVIQNSKAYSCSNWQKGCKFTIWNTIAGKKITAKQVEALIKKGQTGTIKGFKSKTGKTFDAKLVLTDGKVSFDFS